MFVDERVELRGPLVGRAGDTHGELVWQDTLTWIGAPQLRLDPDRPVPLIVFPPPGITRAARSRSAEFRLVARSIA